jgi:MFS superfamily sulfate permease-like transporter
MSKHAWITALISLFTTVILFGIGAVTILILPGLGVEAQLLLPVIVLISVLVAPFAAERLSPRLTPGETGHRDDDVSSGRTYPQGG